VSDNPLVEVLEVDISNLALTAVFVDEEILAMFNI